MHLSIPVAIKFTFTQDTKRAAIDRHFWLVHGGQKCEYSIRGRGSGSPASSVGAEQSSSLLIISHSAECGEKPAASGPDGLFSYARPS